MTTPPDAAQSFAEQALPYGRHLYRVAPLPLMREQGHGRIVNVTSVGGKVSVPHLLPYSMAKFAAVGLSEGLRAELGSGPVTVTTAVPGLMRTGSHMRAPARRPTQRAARPGPAVGDLGSRRSSPATRTRHDAGSRHTPVLLHAWSGARTRAARLECRASPCGTPAWQPAWAAETRMAKRHGRRCTKSEGPRPADPRPPGLTRGRPPESPGLPPSAGKRRRSSAPGADGRPSAVTGGEGRGETDGRAGDTGWVPAGGGGDGGFERHRP